MCVCVCVCVCVGGGGGGGGGGVISIETSIENLSPLYQSDTPTVVNKHEPKNWPPYRKQVVHPRLQTPKGESVAKPETFLLIILSLLCKCEIKEDYGN